MDLFMGGYPPWGSPLTPWMTTIYMEAHGDPSMDRLEVSWMSMRGSSSWISTGQHGDSMEIQDDINVKEKADEPATAEVYNI